jgi:hypothetical protein
MHQMKTLKILVQLQLHLRIKFLNPPESEKLEEKMISEA